MTSEDPNLYARGERLGRWLYDFRCPACGSCGELAMPKAAKSIECPENCGARFVQWQPPMQPRFALRCINEEEARLGIALLRQHAGINGSRGR